MGHPRRYEPTRRMVSSHAIPIGKGSLTGEMFVSPNGAHVLELTAGNSRLVVGMTRQQALDAERLLAAFQRRASEIDDGPELLYSRREPLA